MGIALPQVVTSDRASGAQVIDGSLKFNGGYLTRTPSSNGNRRTWTYSSWIKFDENKDQSEPLFVVGDSSSDFTQIFTYKSVSSDIAISGKTSGSDKVEISSNNLLRDTGWYHIVAVFDSTGSGYQTDTALYVNGVEISRNANTFAGGQNYESWVNSTAEPHYIGRLWNGNTFKGHMSQVYLIDGQALGPENFGFTDPLTGTWRPKKFSGDTTYPNNINTNFSSSLSASSGFNASYPANNAFDGNLESFASSAGASQYLELSSSFTGVTSLRIQCAAGSGFNMGGETYTISGTGITSKVISTDGEAKSLTSISLTSTTISGIRVTSSSGLQARIVAIEINGIILKNNAGWGLNGFYLPMDGNSPIGHDKSNPNPVNNGTVWSNSVTGTPYNANRGGATLFDGSDDYAQSAYPGALTWTPPGGQAFSTLELEVYKEGSNALTIVHAGGTTDVSSQISNNQWYKWTVTGITSPITSITWASTSNAEYTAARAVYIDGIELIDSMYGNGWTPSGFGGSVSLDNRIVSGARPILNTLPGGTQAAVGVFGSEENKFYTVTTANGSVYQFDITSGDNPSLSFIRGATYTFDYSSESGHPLRFSSTNPDSSTTAYTDGTEINSNVIEITVPHNAPDILYYYCSAHSEAMNGSISVTTDETKADKYASSIVLACPYAGDKEDISGNINCTVSNKGSDNYGSIQRGKTGSFYSSSRYFDGSNDNINYGSSSTLGFDGAFTIEMYASPCPNDSSPICSKGYYNASTGNWYFRFSNANGGSMNFYSYNGQGGGQTNSFTNLGCTDTNRMYHVVAQRNSSNLMTFLLDGVIVAQASNVTRNLSDGASSGLSVGRIASGNSSNAAYYWYNGNISDLRIYKGIDKYDVSGKSVGDQVFVPASTSPDILPDTPSGVSGSSKLAKVTDGAVAFDGGGDYLSFADHNDWDIGTGAFTVECFVNINSSSTDYSGIFGMHTGSVQFQWRINAQGRLQFLQDFGGTRGNTDDSSISGTNLRDNSWHHVALTRQSDHSWQLYVDGKVNYSGTGMTGNITNINEVAIGRRADSNSHYLTGFISNLRFVNGTALYTSNFTPPTRELTNVTNTKLLCCQSNTQPGGATIAPNLSGINNGTQWSSFGNSFWDTSNPLINGFDGSTTTIARPANDTNDPRAIWEIPGGIPFTTSLKLRAARDASSSIAKIEVNDVDVTSQFTAGTSTLATVTLTGVTSPLRKIALRVEGGVAQPRFSAVYVDDVMVVDPLTPKGNAAATTFNPFNTDINTVRGQESGYATLNPLSTAVAILTNGNLTYEGGSGMHCVGSTFAVSSGKWYWESFVKPTGNYFYTGIADVSTSYTGNWCGSNSGWSVSVNSSGNICYNNAENLGNIGISVATGQTWGWALDMDAGTFKVYVDGVIRYSGNSIIPGATSLSGRTVTPATGHDDGRDLTYNFGQKPFKFPPPAGFQPLNTANIRPETVITRPDQFVGTTLFTGTGDAISPRTVELPFAADLVWAKSRDRTSYHMFVDTVRGNNKVLSSNDTDLERDPTSYFSGGGVASINGKSISIESGSSNNANLNTNNEKAVVWSWKAGGNKNTFNVDDVGYASAAAAGLGASGNSWDSDPTGASVGTKQGFSIIKHTGTGSAGTLPHGLTQKPDFYISKPVNTSGNWVFYTDLIDGSLDYLYLNTTAAKDNSGQSLPTSEIFSYGYTANEYIHYLWHNVPGLQKFGSYTGNGAQNFVSLDFRPAIVWVKRAVVNSSPDSGSTYSSWTIMDSARLSYNGLTPNHLYANKAINEGYRGNGSGASNADITLEPLSNGFYINGPGTETNANTGTYIYCAWAEAPTFNLYGAQSNAR